METSIHFVALDAFRAVTLYVNRLGGHLWTIDVVVNIAGDPARAIQLSSLELDALVSAWAKEKAHAD